MAVPPRFLPCWGRRAMGGRPRAPVPRSEGDPALCGEGEPCLGDPAGLAPPCRPVAPPGWLVVVVVVVAVMALTARCTCSICACRPATWLSVFLMERCISATCLSKRLIFLTRSFSLVSRSCTSCCSAFRSAYRHTATTDVIGGKKPTTQ